MPSPVGRPADTVSPEVSECSRIPDRRRPAASATSPCAPSWAMVTTCRVGRQRRGGEDQQGGDRGGAEQHPERQVGGRRGDLRPEPAQGVHGVRLSTGSTARGPSSALTWRTRARLAAGSTTTRSVPPAARARCVGLQQQARAPRWPGRSSRRRSMVAASLPTSSQRGRGARRRSVSDRHEVELTRDLHDHAVAGTRRRGARQPSAPARPAPTASAAAAAGPCPRPVRDPEAHGRAAAPGWAPCRRPRPAPG